MKKLIIATAVSLGLGSVTANANDIDWVGAYGMYYDIDGDKPEPIPYLEDGFAGGLEVGFRFSPRWGARIEAAYMEVDNDGSAVARNQYGMLYGVDAMYFLENDDAYLFAGAKVLDLSDTYNMVNAGVGRHWHINDKFRVITEVAGYYAFEDRLRDVSFKIGLAYTLGDTPSNNYVAQEPAQLAAAAAPADSDKDGVVDSADRCPGTPMGTKVDSNGCAMPVEKDTDGDGVVDSADKCPGTPSTDAVDSDGCSRFGEEVVSQNVRVLFANNSDEITNPGDAEIVDFANFMKRFGKVDAVIEGHASAPGNDDYNMKLSQRRADAFRTLLIERYGIASRRLTAQGFGETQLLDTSNTAEAHRINRRIVVNVSETVKVKVKR
jgi:OOP family OmpA-OmpF porin